MLTNTKLSSGYRKWVVITLIGGLIVAYGISLVWPRYEFDLRVPSPDGRYDLVVLRGNASAFDDFSYNIYAFPHAQAPRAQIKGSRVWLTSNWRGRKYLVYSGYNYPMFRWVGARAIEIDIDELYPEPFMIEPIKRFFRVKRRRCNFSHLW